MRDKQQTQMLQKQRWLKETTQQYYLKESEDDCICFFHGCERCRPKPKEPKDRIKDRVRLSPLYRGRTSKYDYYKIKTQAIARRRTTWLTRAQFQPHKFHPLTTGPMTCGSLTNHGKSMKMLPVPQNYWNKPMIVVNASSIDWNQTDNLSSNRRLLESMFLPPTDP
jgi:hypothetical protein